MTQFLPPNLLALFAPREPLTFLPPYGKLPHEKNSKPYTGVANFLTLFEHPKDTPPPTRVETRDERRERKRKERSEMVAYKLEQDLALWDPNSDQSIRGDPYKTLFIARINYDTTESKLRREFDNFGPIKQVHMIVDNNTGKPRGYAFIEYEHERDMHAAYKLADGKKIDGRRVLVDVERGRTVKGWRPRRLGGGLGSTRKGGTEENTKYSGRDDFDARERGGIPEDRVVRGDSRERDRDRERDRRRRSPSRERHRSRDRKKRSREKIKKSPDIKRELEDATKINPLMDDSTRRRHRRSRSRDKDAKERDKDRDRKRSRSRENRDRKRPKRSRSRDRHRGDKMVAKFKKEEPLDDGQAGIPLGVNGDNRRIKTETAEAPPDPEYNPYQQAPPYNQYNQQGYDQAYGQYNYGENQ